MTRPNMSALATYLRRRQVAYYAGYPSALCLVASYFLEHGLELPHPPRWVFTGAETLLPHQRALIEEGLQTRVADQYGASEYCGNISECEHHRYHVDMEFGAVELLPIEGADATQRRIVCTGFHNPAMPLLRYDIGDVATLDPRRDCPCGREAPTVLSIDGRIESYIMTPDGRQCGRLDFVFKDSPNIVEAQFVQHEIASVVVNVVRGPAFSESDVDNLRRGLRKYLGDAIELDLRFVTEIKKAKNGKFRQIVSSLETRVPFQGQRDSASR